MNSIKNICTSSWKAILIASLLLIFGCAENGIIEETPQLIIPDSQELVSGTLYGRVIDESGIAIAEAQVSYLSGLEPLQIETNEEGYFLIENVKNKGRAAFVSIRFEGKFEAFRKFSVIANRYNYTEVKMLDRKIVGSVESTQGGTITNNDRSSITLPSDGIINNTGQAYSGQVDIAMTWIDPSAEDLSQRMIGDLSGVDEEGNYRSLASFGMLQVELIGSNGQLLNLAEGAEASLEFPVPSSMQNDATPSIPLWSYNEVVGTWVQEGNAILEGNKYVGMVKHFSSWNVDHMTDPIAIEGQIKWSSEDGPIGGAYLKVYVCSDNIGRKGGWLCEDGSFRFYNFPKDETFKLKVLNNCGDEIYKETYGPYSEDKDLGVIQVTTNNSITKIIGNAINCEGQPVSNGSVSIRQKDRLLTFPINENGEFEFGVDFCSDAPAFLQVVDLDSLLTNTIEIDPTKGFSEVKDFKVCDELEEFISYSLDGGESQILTSNIFVFNKTLEDSLGTFDAIKILYEAEDSTGAQRFSLIFETVTTIPTTINAQLEISSGRLRCFAKKDSDIAVTITKFGTNIGDTIEGSFTGKMFCLGFDDNQNQIEEELPVSGTFKVILK